MIRYTRLWETMKRKNISQYYLIHSCGVSAGQLYRLRKNQPVSTHTLEMLCEILECRIEDVVEFVPESAEQPTK